MYKIVIQQFTSIQDIQLWSPKKTNIVIFELSNYSSFGLFAEGVAIGKLRDLELDGFKICINLPHSPVRRKTKEEKEKAIPVSGVADGNEVVENDKLPPILSSLFGLELLFVSSSVVVQEDDLGINLRALIGDHIFIKALQNLGVITSGGCLYLISRHGYDIPVALREPSSERTFPSFLSFQKSLRLYISKLRGGDKDSSTEKDLIEWVFHCAENSYEHASTLNGKPNGKPIKGFRGIILQKIRFGSRDDIENRRDLPQCVRNYLFHRMKDGHVGTDSVLKLVTVVDLGKGIHNTIPDGGHDLDIERLRYTFKDGVTSKNTSESEQAGRGLGFAADAARHLKALLFIVSSDLGAFYDFSEETGDEIPGSQLELISIREKINKRNGSSISIIWVSKPMQEDQFELTI